MTTPYVRPVPHFTISVSIITYWFANIKIIYVFVICA